VDPTKMNPVLEGLKSAPLKQKVKADQIIKRPNLGLMQAQKGSVHLNELANQYDEKVKEQADILLKYETYIDKEQKVANKLNTLENFKINETLNYEEIKALSNEAREKLKKVKPQTIGQASRISGVNPSDISILMVYLDK